MKAFAKAASAGLRAHVTQRRSALIIAAAGLIALLPAGASAVITFNRVWITA